MGIDQLLKKRRHEILQLAQMYGVKQLRVFGSVARGEAKENSDLDLLATFEKDRNLLDLIGFRQDLEDLLGKKVDVVSEGGVSPFLRKQISQEAIPL